MSSEASDEESLSEFKGKIHELEELISDKDGQLQETRLEQDQLREHAIKLEADLAAEHDEVGILKAVLFTITSESLVKHNPDLIYCFHLRRI